MLRLVILFVSLFALAGCAQSTPAVPPTPSSVPDAPTPPTQAEAIVVYNKSGCIQGLNDTLTVFGNGNLELVNRLGERQTAVARPEAVKTLRLLLAQPQFRQLEAKYTASGADLCTYRITEIATGKTVEATDAAQYPENLQQVIRELEGLRALVH